MLYLIFCQAHKSILLLDLLNFYRALPPFDEWSYVIILLLNVSSFHLCYCRCCSFRSTRSKIFQFVIPLGTMTVSVVLDNFSLLVIQLLWWRCLSQNATFLQLLTSNVLDFDFLLWLSLSHQSGSLLSLWFRLCRCLMATRY